MVDQNKFIALRNLFTKLKNLKDRVDDILIFGDVKNLPLNYDISMLPEDMPNRDQVHELLSEFYGRRTKCVCRMRGCHATMEGFREIVQHQSVHGRRYSHICVKENCMVPFDKNGNARRHQETQHGCTVRRAIAQARSGAGDNGMVRGDVGFGIGMIGNGSGRGVRGEARVGYSSNYHRRVGGSRYGYVDEACEMDGSGVSARGWWFDGYGEADDSDDDGVKDGPVGKFSMQHLRERVRECVGPEYTAEVITALMSEYPRLLHDRPPLGEVLKVAQGAVHLFQMGQYRDIDDTEDEFDEEEDEDEVEEGEEEGDEAEDMDEDENELGRELGARGDTGTGAGTDVFESA